ncbi:MAG: hypothetical protein ACJATI_005615, partial [Halioglobus sp.]
SGDKNIYIGLQAGTDFDGGHENVFIGTKSGKGQADSSIDQSYFGEAYNNFIGYETGAYGTEGYRNNYIGFRAGAGSENTSDPSNSGANNTFIGSHTGEFNTTGVQNVFLGTYAGRENAAGQFNVCIGPYAGQSLVGQGDNQNPENRKNINIGYYAGQMADESANPGTDNIMIGTSTEFAVGNIQRSIAIGIGVVIDSSDIVRIGNGSITSIGGGVNWTSYSDGRFKDNVIESVPGLSFINQLRPVQYNFNSNEFHNYLGVDLDNRNIASENAKYEILQTGFIAQEVEQAAIDIAFNFNGVDKPKSSNGYYGLRYSEFVVPLVKAVQEQQIIIDDSKVEIIDLETTVANQAAQIATLLDAINDLDDRVRVLEN